jgi:hypothetical protein
VNEMFSDPAAFEKELLSTRNLQQEIWSRAVVSSRGDSSQTAARLLLPALNEMIDITNSRLFAGKTHMPPLIVGLLVSVALLSGLIAGYSMAKRGERSWFHVILYAVVVAITIYATLDLEYPRFGLIRIDGTDKALVELQDSIR